MSSQVAPPPTWAPVVNKDGSFNVIWLNWFLSLVNVVNQTGSSGIQHNSLLGIQGGNTNQYYHLDSPTFSYITNGNSMARQSSTSVAITGGTIDGTPIGSTTPAAGVFSSLKFGTYTAGVITQAGSVSITDSGGTTRRLLVG